MDRANPLLALLTATVLAVPGLTALRKSGTPGHTGGSDDAQCAQTASVQPASSYTLTGHVRGSYVYLGASGTGTTDVSARTRSAPDRFVLTMAPETFFVQNGYQYYGTGKWGGQDPRCGACLPVIHALLHVQDDDSGSIMGLDNQYHSAGGADFHIAMTDMLLTGFPVAGDPDHVFPPLRPGQVAIATAPGRTRAA